MTRVTRFLIPVALLLPMPICAQSATEKASLEVANQTFWRFSNCVVRHDGAGVVRVLAVENWDKDNGSALTNFLQRHGGCLEPGDALTAEGNLFRGVLAGAYFVARTGDGALPDYMGVPPIFDQVRLDREVDPQAKVRIAFLSFAECVFRSSPIQVRALLTTKPADNDEARAFQSLSRYFDLCLPAREGTQIKFKKISMRGFLGEAAYAVDQAKLSLPTQAPKDAR